MLLPNPFEPRPMSLVRYEVSGIKDEHK